MTAVKDEAKLGWLVEWSFHEVGSAACDECWINKTFDCTDGCPGQIHSEFVDETIDGYLLRYRCDVCGDTSKPEE